MCHILNIETSSTNCSVSLSKNGKLISIKEENDEKYSHSTKLHLFIKDVLEESNINVNELSAVSVSKGPGSYTGLRIGVAAAKGLCFSLDIPLISISTLLILAKQVQIDSGYILPVLDSRSNEVYSAVYDHKFNLIENDSPVALKKDSFKKYLKNNKVNLVGSGQNKFKDIISDSKNLIFFDTNAYPSSKEMPLLSYQKFQNEDFENLAYFEPAYLKNFILDSLSH
jgi:tRNA threonylcarbamoyladenosine biosynthesis protein TsaB